MRRALGLAARSLLRRPIVTALLALTIALPASLPFALNAVVARAAGDMMARAKSTPLLVGSRGRPVEAVLNSLTFRTPPAGNIPYRQTRTLTARPRYLSAPLNVRFEARGQPIVGTTLEYFHIRGLHIASGRSLALAGECVVGAAAARRLELAPGDVLVSSRDEDHTVADAVPLAMQVVGVLAETGTRDDNAIFVDVVTTWMIAGHIHGHPPDLELEDPVDDEVPPPAYEDELTPENLELFHAHRPLGDLPITGIVVVPFDDATAADALDAWPKRGPTELLRPADVMASVLPAVLPARRGVVATIVGAAVLGATTAALSFALSFLIRRGEFAVAIQVTGSRADVLVAAVIEGAAVLLLAAAIAAGLVSAVGRMLETQEPHVAKVALGGPREHLDVHAVNEPLRYLATRLGGKRVTATFPAPEGADPARWVPPPEVIAGYQQADLVFLNGVDHARWTRLATLRRASLVDISRGIGDELIRLPGERHTHDTGDAAGDPATAPETWMDPLLAAKQAEAMADALALRLVRGLDAVPVRLQRLGADLFDVHARLLAATRPLAGETVLFSSPIYAYFARRYELDGPTLDWTPEGAPTPRQWADLADLVRERPARLMFWHAPPAPATLDRLAEMGIRSVVYPAGTARVAGHDYLSLLRANVLRLEAATEGMAPGPAAGAADPDPGNSAANPGAS